MDYKEMLKRAKQNLPAAAGGSRFEVPSPIVQPLKRSTVVKNFGDISKAIRREPKQIAKFLFKALAVPGTIAGVELILNGKVSTSAINQRIRDYVDEYVTCRECGKPDTMLAVDGAVAKMKCEACGARRTFKMQ